MAGIRELAARTDCEVVANGDRGSKRHWAAGIALEFLSEREKSLSRVQLFESLWTIACQAPPSMGFSKQEYWSGVPLPSPGDLSDPGIEPRSPSLQADCLPSEPARKPRAPGAGLIPEIMEMNMNTKRSMWQEERQSGASLCEAEM